MTKMTLLLLYALFLPELCFSWTTSSPQQSTTTTTTTTTATPFSNNLSRRDALTTVVTAAISGVGIGGASGLIRPQKVMADTISSTTTNIADNEYRYEIRDRYGNKDAVIREDFWYTSGITPPRKLTTGQILVDDPKWNAFGSCETSGTNSAGTNSCTYISLKQRQPAYSKYGYSIIQGIKEYQQLGYILQKQDWDTAKDYVFINTKTNLPPPTIDAILKMVLFASSMLTSPNFSGVSKELLVARFYVNEYKFALNEMQDAIQQRDMKRAIAAWQFGKDSFNSYNTIVNRQITAKVGDPFPIIE